MNHMKFSLRYKTGLAILVSFLMISIIVVRIEFNFQAERSRAILAKDRLMLKTLMQSDEDFFANEIFENSIRALRIRIDAIMKTSGMKHIGIYDRTGRLMVSDSGIPQASRSSFSMLEPEFRKTMFQIPEESGGGVLRYCREIKAIGETIGFIVLDYSLEDLKTEQKKSWFLIGGIILTIFIIMMFVLNLILSYMIIKPITKLRDTMDKIRDRKINEPVIIDSNDEIADLSETFNQMSEELLNSYKTLEAHNKALKESERKINKIKLYLSSIIDSMPSAIIGTDCQGTIRQWNREAEKMLGISSSQALNSNIQDYLSVTGLEKEDIRKILKTKQIHSVKQTFHSGPDQRKTFQTTLYPLTAPGLDDIIIRIDDITEQVMMQEAVIHSEKMESVGALAVGMAHEINNPLAGILQSAQVILNRLSLDTPPNRQAASSAGTDMAAINAYMEKRNIIMLFSNIISAGKRASGIVKDMLSFIRKESGSFVPWSMNRLLDETINLARADYNLKKKYDFKKIGIVREYQHDLPEILCEGSKIQQVFFNLFKNGAYAMHEIQSEGYKPEFRIQTALRNGMVKIEIEDNGPGMDEATRKRIFEPFFTTKPVGRGTGLGLSVSYFIITEIHKGKMSVESAHGRGARFIIQIPVNSDQGINNDKNG